MLSANSECSTRWGRGTRFRHEGRRDRRERVNVDSGRFHEGRGAGKTDTPGGHRLVNKKRIVSGKEKLRAKNSYGKTGSSLNECYTGALVSRSVSPLGIVGTVLRSGFVQG